MSEDFSDCHIPDGVSLPEAHARTSHLGIGAHQDDLEFMAYHGISTCYEEADHWFSGIICTDGGGSARSGPFKNLSDDAMKRVRIQEQQHAADIGRYSFVQQLGLPSAHIKTPEGRQSLVEHLEQLLLTTQPEVLYTHNPADKHATHVAVCLAVLEAVRRVPPHSRPKRVYGCEVWRDLDWLADADKIALDVGSHPELAARLNACFQSQIVGGKNYARAVEGRARANATFYESHQIDLAEKLWFAMDLTPLAEDPDRSIREFVADKLRTFQNSVLNGLEFGGT